MAQIFSCSFCCFFCSLFCFFFFFFLPDPFPLGQFSVENLLQHFSPTKVKKGFSNALCSFRCSASARSTSLIILCNCKHEVCIARKHNSESAYYFLHTIELQSKGTGKGVNQEPANMAYILLETLVRL